MQPMEDIITTMTVKYGKHHCRWKWSQSAAIFYLFDGRGLPQPEYQAFLRSQGRGDFRWRRGEGEKRKKGKGQGLGQVRVLSFRDLPFSLLSSLFPPRSRHHSSFTVFVVIGATSIVFVSYFHYDHLYHCCSHFQKNPTLGLVLISRCHLKIYTVQMSKLPPISVSKFLDDVSTQILLLTSLSLRQSLVQPS